MLQRVQEWLADRGLMQYPIPRRRPRVYEQGEIGLRLVVGLLGLFWTTLLVPVVIAMTCVLVIFVLAVLGAV